MEHLNIFLLQDICNLSEIVFEYKLQIPCWDAIYYSVDRSQFGCNWNKIAPDKAVMKN